MDSTAHVSWPYPLAVGVLRCTGVFADARQGQLIVGAADNFMGEESDRREV